MIKVDLNSTRTIRQKEGARKLKLAFVKEGGGLIRWGAGIGKTYLITDLINKPLMEKFPNKEICICVGTNYLVGQWESRISNPKREKVYTWQSMYNKPKKSVKCKLLVIDEAHTILLTEEYSKIKEVFDYEWCAMLTATPTDEHIERLINIWGYPVVDHIPYYEALEQGWVSAKKEFNLSVQLPYSESAQILHMEAELRRKLSYIDPDVDNPENFTGFVSKTNVEKAMKKVITGYQLVNGGSVSIPEGKGSFKQRMNQTYNSKKDSIKHYKTGKNLGKPRYTYSYPLAELLAKKRNTDVGTILNFATKCHKLSASIASCLYSNSKKLDVIDKLLDLIQGKGFIFTTRTSLCDDIVALRPKELRPYHNSIEGITEEQNGKKKKVGKSKLLDRYVDEFVNGDVKALVSIRKIEAGADFKGVSFAINHSYYSKWAAHEQKMGRVTRAEQDDKEAIIINLYSEHHPAFMNKRTTEYYWIRNAQKNQKNVEWVSSLDDIKNYIINK